MKNEKALFTGVFLVGLAVLVFGFVQAEGFRNYRDECTLQTEGTVIDVDKRRTGGKNRRTVYELDVMYYVDEQAYTIYTDPTSTKAKIGDKAIVLYSPDDPGYAYVKGRKETGATFFAAAGTFWFIGLVGVIGSRIKNRDKNDE